MDESELSAVNLNLDRVDNRVVSHTSPTQNPQVLNPFSESMDELELSAANLNLGGVDNKVVSDILPTQTVGSLRSKATPIAIEPPEYTPKAFKASPQLPPEIVNHIMSFIHHRDQRVFANACKVSRAWYHAAIRFL